MMPRCMAVTRVIGILFFVATVHGGEVVCKPGYEALVSELGRLVEHELVQKRIPSLSLALTVGDEIVVAKSWGVADPVKGIKATPTTVYRAGSVSKLFTCLAVMQLVEKGELDLDVPVETYLPDFRPKNPFGVPITLRMLMSHRAGLVREPPRGNYFDPGEPSLADSVASLNETSLVYRPGTKTKYSNAGFAVVGYVLEKRLGRPFAEILRERVVRPLRLESTDFELTPAVRARLAQGTMWTYDGREFAAPVFLLGTSAAGNLFASVTDLAEFLIALGKGGEAAGGQLLHRDTLESMWKVQFTDGTDGFGLGFDVRTYRGERRIRHGGEVYGFSTEVSLLPAKRLGVVVASSMDVTSAVIRRVADRALDLLLDSPRNTAITPLDLSKEVPIEKARALVGLYRRHEDIVRVRYRGHRLMLDRGAMKVEVRHDAQGFLVDDRHAYGPRITQANSSELTLGDEPYRRIEDALPPDPPDRWRGLIGEYGWDHNTLYIHEKNGRLHALIEWFFDYPLTEKDANRFAFPDDGLYHGEELVFDRDANGQAKRVVAASVVFARRASATPEGSTFRIRPERPIEELRRTALAAAPPVERGAFRRAELVELKRLDPSLRYDIRYAGTNNFMGSAFYEEPNAYLQKPAADALVRVQQKLKQRGYGLLIHDAYRPWFVTKMFWDATPRDMKIFVANPESGSRHNRGCAVDLTLCDLTSGEPVSMVSGYDEFSHRAFPEYPGGTSRQRWHRDLLRDAMESEGFTVYEFEWWHFDHKDWRHYAIHNVTFDQIR